MPDTIRPVLAPEILERAASLGRGTVEREHHEGDVIAQLRSGTTTLDIYGLQ